MLQKKTSFDDFSARTLGVWRTDFSSIFSYAKLLSMNNNRKCNFRFFFGIPFQRYFTFIVKLLPSFVKINEILKIRLKYVGRL